MENMLAIRQLWNPIGSVLEKRTGNYQNTRILFYHVRYRITDNITIGVGTISKLMINVTI